MHKKLHRRTLLRGMGGVAIALPLLEIMQQSEASAQAAPLRYLVSYGGLSTGRPEGDLVTPDAVGAGYDIKHSLMHLGDGSAYGVSGFDIQDYVSVVSGLTIPWEGQSGGAPPGGKIRNFHYCTVQPQMSGMRVVEPAAPPLGPTSDHVVAAALGVARRSYCVQPSGYISSLGTISFREDGGQIVPEDPITSPRLAYEGLFTGFEPADPVEAEKARRLLLRRKSAIDLVRGGLERLLPRLGRADAVRMERHLDEIRALETRLDHVTPVGGNCQLLEHPGEDPPIGGTWTYDPVSCTFTNFSPDVGWSDEELRAELLADFIHMAFVCDLCRVVSFQLTDWKCYMNAYHITGNTSNLADVHGLGHGGTSEEHSLTMAWHVKHFLRLAAKLRDTPEGDGNLLDRSAMTLLFEGGWGYDPEGGTGPSTHSTENMIAIVAGKAGGLNQPSSQHIPTGGMHPAQVLVTAMNAVGVETDTLGEVSGTIPGLRG
jgi:hypothetical protein